MGWFFRQCEKWIIRKTAMDYFFHIYRSHGVCKISYDHSSMYHNLQEKLNTWLFSSLRGFACHSCLENLHCTHLQCSVALIRPPESISDTLVYACGHMRRARFWSISLRCFCKDTCTRLLRLNLAKITSHSVAMTYRKRIFFLFIVTVYLLCMLNTILYDYKLLTSFLVHIMQTGWRFCLYNQSAKRELTLQPSSRTLKVNRLLPSALSSTSLEPCSNTAFFRFPFSASM